MLTFRLKLIGLVTAHANPTTKQARSASTMSAALDMDHLAGWVGREETAVDLITPALVDRFSVTLGGSALGLHWCLAPPTVPMSNVGHDGHPKKGGFLPPVPLQYRMWAAGETICLLYTSPSPRD